jgi:site-specific DNA recombinase
VRAAIYARLSKDRSGLSVNVGIQEAEAREYAAEHGHEVVAVHSDNDLSASRYSSKPRPGYEALWRAIESGSVEAVIVTEMTRLYRRLEELLDLIHLAERTNLKSIETTDGVGYRLNTGEGIHAAVAAINNAVLESRKISDRQRRKQAAKAREGLSHGGRGPLATGRATWSLTKMKPTFLGKWVIDYLPATRSKRSPTGAMIKDLQPAKANSGTP